MIERRAPDAATVPSCVSGAVNDGVMATPVPTLR